MRVAIAEDSVLLREGLTRILGDAGLDVVAAYDNADDLLRYVRSFPPEVAILDIRLPPTHNDEGMRAALQIRERIPESESWCCRSTSSSAWRCNCCPNRPRASATC